LKLNVAGLPSNVLMTDAVRAGHAVQGPERTGLDHRRGVLLAAGASWVIELSGNVAGIVARVWVGV
jgi:hypothetical protein